MTVITARSDLPISALDFTDPAFVRDPYPALHAVRALGPLAWHEGLGQYLVTGYRDCARVFGNATRFTSNAEVFIELFGGLTMEAMEQPRHDEVRGIWASAFHRTTMEEHRAMIAGVVENRLWPFVERLRAGETVDAVEAMTRDIPTIVIAALLGIPESDHRQFIAWSDDMAASSEGLTDFSPRGAELARAGKVATAELNEYLRALLPGRRANPGPDLISTMVTSPVAAGMTEQEIVASNTQLVLAGNETTAKLMAHTLLALSRHPDQLQLLRSDRSLLARAIEEIHRWNTVVHAGWRTVRGDGHQVAGVPVRDGETVLCLQGAANRDPARWSDPDVLDITRDPVQHLGFGFGMHSCLGINLARLEMQIWLSRLLDELPEWQVGDVEWSTNWILRGPTSLAVSAA